MKPVLARSPMGGWVLYFYIKSYVVSFHSSKNKPLFSEREKVYSHLIPLGFGNRILIRRRGL